VAISYSERVGKALEILSTGLAPFVDRECRAVLGADWVQKAADYAAPGGRVQKVSAEDVQFLLKVMWDTWNAIFGKTLSRADRTLVSELRDVRNKWAHQETFSGDDAYRALDSVQRLLQSVAAEEAAEVDRIKQDVLRQRFDEQARREKRKATSSPVEGMVVAGLRAWREIVTPHQDVASGRYQQAEFAADLAQVHRGEGSDEYRDPEEFFRRTFITEGLGELLVEATRSLSEVRGDPVVNLQTNFGGGKTHSLLALYHLFSGVDASKLAGVDAIVEKADVKFLPKAYRAVLVGTAISPGQPHKKPDSTEIRTLWGELAWQLGGAEGFALVADADRTSTSPGDALRELFKIYSPCLVLIDEWVAYARQLYGKDDLPAGTFDTHFTFAQALTEAARAVPGTFVVVSIPASEQIQGGGAEVSEIEVGGEGGRAALDRLKNVISRMDSPWRPATAEESFEIVRRRLFQAISDPQLHAERDGVVKAFSEFYKSQAEEFPGGCREKSYERRMAAAYPIHPELFDRLYEDWSSLERFQRTRGVLRLMAGVIHALWERQDASPLIMPASLPIDDVVVFSELTRYLEDNWKPVIEADVDGPNALPLEIDRANPNLGRYSASRRVARTIYLGSAPTARTAHRGIEDRSVKLGCVLPGESPAIFGDALRRLTDVATYLYVDGRRYWYSVQPSVTSLAQDRAAQFSDDDVLEEIRKRLRNDRQRGEFAAVHVTPTSSAEVEDEAATRLVILDPSKSHSPKTQDSPARNEAVAILESRGASPRNFRNMLIFLAADKSRLAELKQAIRQHAAWFSIESGAKQLNLDAFQTGQATTKRQQADETVKHRILETFQWLLIPNQPSTAGPTEWEETKVQGNEGLAARASKKLQSDESLIVQYAGTLLRRELDRIPLWDGDHVEVRKLWDHFARYIYLPRLRDREVLRNAIVQGVSSLSWDKETFAYADAWDEAGGRYLGLVTASFPNVNMDGASVIVNPLAAVSQLAQEKPEEVPSQPAVVGDGALSTPTPPAERKLRRFYGAVEIQPLRMTRDAGEIAEAIVQHLSSLPDADVRLTLEIEASVPDGAPEQVVRTVTENARTLKFKVHGFEEE
jgi:predicted AAA+ superfamily ATPase